MFAFVIVGHGKAKQKAGGERDGLNAGQDTEDLDIEPHVAVDDVAELVGDDALQLISLEAIDGSLRDADDSVLRVEAGGEGVDATLVGENEDGGGLDARGKCHPPKQ